MARRRRTPVRRRIGRVSLYPHHGAWWVYFRESGRQVRRRVANVEAEAEQIAARINSELTSSAPTMLTFQPISTLELRAKFLAHHEQVLKSSVATVRRYRAATQHLVDFAGHSPAHTLAADRFALFLREKEVSPNGHPHTAMRRLRDKGVRYLLEVCRSLYAFAIRMRHLPPYAENPFSQLQLDRMQVEDAKPIFVFDQQSELCFLNAADDWSFPLHFMLAKTGLRVGELVHLLIEDLDLPAGWLQVRNKADLGWKTKTRNERAIPLLPEVVAVLRRVIGARRHGPVFLRRSLQTGMRQPLLQGTPAELGSGPDGGSLPRLSQPAPSTCVCAGRRGLPYPGDLHRRQSGYRRPSLGGDDGRRRFTAWAAHPRHAAPCPQNGRLLVPAGRHGAEGPLWLPQAQSGGSGVRTVWIGGFANREGS